MSLRVEHIHGTHSVRSFDVPYWQNCAVRIQNLVSKYFLEYAELLLPCNILRRLEWGVHWLYWSVKDLFFPCWLERFKNGVQLARRKPVFEFDNAKLQRFSNSAEASQLTDRYPFACLWNKGANWFSPTMGTCYGESLALMKYKEDCAISSGFERRETLSAADLGNEVLFLQAMHFLDNHFKWILDTKKQMKSHGIATRDISSKESSVQQAWLFHYMRKSGIPRRQARYLSEHFQELFTLPLRELQNRKDSIAPGLEEMVGEPLNFNAYSSEDERTQSELDADVSEFLLQDSGVYTLIGIGKNQIGHAMFLKVEDGQCMTYDPATKECFTMPHTLGGICKMLELMKKTLAMLNFGGKIRYQVIRPLA